MQLNIIGKQLQITRMKLAFILFGRNFYSMQHALHSKDVLVINAIPGNQTWAELALCSTA